VTVEENRPRGRLEHTGGDPGHSALARTVLTEQRVHFTGGDVEVEPVDRPSRSEQLADVA
jgi:hypothetical protein